MYRSLNEIDQTVRKAVRGRGFPWGLADEAGKAVRSLHQYGLNGVGMLTNVLDEFNYDHPGAHTPLSISGIWKAPAGTLNPLLTGPSLADCINAGIRQKVELRNLACPLLLAAYLPIVSGSANCSRTVNWGPVSVGVFQDRLSISGSNEELHVAFCERVDCGPLAQTAGDGFPHPHIGEVIVDDDEWDALERYACLTYVEATEASRLAGAGAGLSDND